MKIKNKILSFILLTAFVFPMIFAITGCSDTGAENNIIEWLKREPADKGSYDFTDSLYLPRADAPVSEIQYIDLSAKSNNEIFLAIALQGNVNRGNPSMYVVSNPMIEGNMNASEYWLEKLDELYPETYTKKEYTDLYQMVIENIDKISGYILYDARLADDKMRSRNYYSSLYGDMALLDLTINLCSVENAIPLTREQLYILRTEYGFNLTRKGDTTLFMEQENGEISQTAASRASKSVWYNVFEYTLNNLSSQLNDNVIAHNPAFQIPSMDYWIQNEVLVYTRIFGTDASEAERKMEEDLLATVKNNAPVVGCFYLQSDEGSYVPYLTSRGKSMVCTYETYNISWTCGLPVVTPKQTQDRALTVEEGKIYVSFDLSEGDNSSYHYFRVPQFIDESSASTIIGWSTQPTIGEITPNMQKYFNSKYGDYFSIVTPEAGAGYTYTTAPKETQYEFFKWTEAYLQRNGSDTLRMLKTDYIDALPYAENVQGLNAVLLGYMGESEKMWNTNENANFLYNDTVFFRHYDGRNMNDIAKYNSTEPAFFSVSLYGWNQSGTSVETIMKNLDERFVLVSPGELADLYKQQNEKNFKDVNGADFSAGFTKEELGFLNYASDHNQVNTKDKTRNADGINYLKYKFDLDDNAENLEITLQLSGRYQVEFSKDNLNWGVVDRSSSYLSELITKKYSLDSFLSDNDSNTVYMRVGDATPENGSGAVLGHISVRTEMFETENVHLNNVNDGVYLINDSSDVNSKGRKGDFTYKFNLAYGITSLQLSADIEGTKTVEISQDGIMFETLHFDGTLGSTKYADITSLLSGENMLYVKFGGTGILKQFKLTSSKPVTSLSFTPNGTKADNTYGISLDDNKVNGANSINSYTAISGSDAALYKFVIGSGVTDTRLDLNITGTYKISVSNDGKTFTEVRSADIGGGLQKPYVYTDITPYATAGKTLYVKAELIDSTSDKVVRLYGIRLFTNLAPDSLKARYEAEREPDYSVAPSWNGNNVDGNRDYGEENQTSFEYQLIDQSLSNGQTIYMHNYVSPLRALKSGESYFTYKLDFSAENIAFWQQNIPSVFTQDFELTDLRIDFDIAEAYIAWVSTDGENWTLLLDSGLDDSYRGGASNRQVETVKLSEYLENNEGKVIYIKFADNTPTNGWGTIIFNINFYFN